MSLKFLTIDHIHIHVKNRTEAEKWYRTILRFERVNSLEFWSVDGGPLMLEDESGQIHLAMFESESIQNTIIAFKVTAQGLYSWISHLSNLGVCVDPVNHDISWSIYFSDPDGNPFEITTYEYNEFANILETNA